MALSAGSKLGPHEILSLIGAGGMGEVYQAKDTKLGRDVAVKILPEVFAQDKERLARFEREARLLASLNHPNIATIHGLEESDGVRFLVMELVEGETLADLIAKGPIPVEEALPLFQQIAEGLEAAHEKGVVHRDLKPANVKVTPDGKAKVLDFGLARAAEAVPEIAGEGASQSPTLTKGTALGAIMGTASYMSPEQARGKVVDKRTDIWAFGVVLYEALTGARPFKGETVTDTLASVIKGEPEWKAVPAGTPSDVRRLLRRCLEKVPRRRLQDIGDARIEIEEAMAEPFDATDAAKLPGPAPWRSVLPWGVTALVLIASFALWMIRPSTEVNEATRPLNRFSIQLPADQHVAMDQDNPLMAISRDGQQLAWIGTGEPERIIYTRAFDDLAVRPISGTEGVANTSLSFSPDTRWIAFSRDGALWKISVEGGVATSLFQSESASQIWSTDWGEDGTIVVSLAHSGLRRVPDTGGELEKLTTLDRERGEVAHERPVILPEQRGILFAVATGNMNDEHVEVLDLDTGKRRVVIENTFKAQYVPTGHLLFGREGTLLAAPFDLDLLEVIGPETPVLSNVQTDTSMGRAAEFVVSRNGTLAYIPGGQGFGEQRLAWVDRRGGTETLSTPLGMYTEPSLSPDGAELAIVSLTGHVRQVALYDLSRDVLTQFTFEGSSNAHPVWSPDGTRLAFQSSRAGQWNLFVKPLGGDSPAVQLQESANIQAPLSWSPDGTLLTYYERSASDNYDVWLLPVDGASPQPTAFLDSEAYESHARFSPDGDWIAYASAEEGQLEVFVREVAIGSGEKRKVSRDGGRWPRWSRDGRELFYLSRDTRRLLSVSIQTEPNFEIGEQKTVLEELDLPASRWSGGGGVYDVSPDGERFLMVLENEPPETMELVVVLNWTEELKRLAPGN